MDFLLFFFFSLCLIWSALANALPERPRRGISHSLLTNFTLMAQYSAAAGCNANTGSSAVGMPISCDGSNCPLIDETETEILYAFTAAFVSPYSSTGFIAADHTHRTLIFAIRNTETGANFYTDFEIIQVDASSACPGCRAHLGFWLSAAAAKRELTSPIMETMAKYPHYKMMFTGHSLGGAVVALYAALWRENGVQVEVYTFGAPSVGNYAFAGYFSDDWQDLGTTYRVTHLDDMVPKILYRLHREPITGSFMPEYSQSSPEYWITAESGEDVLTRDVVVLHGVNNEKGNLGSGRTSMSLPHISNWIDGSYTPPSLTPLQVLNPATEVPLATINSTSSQEVNEIITSSWKTFHSGTWSKSDADTRFSVLTRAASLLRSKLPEIIPLETAQTGRPIREMRAQLSRVPEWLEYFASLARTHEGRVTPFKGPVLNTLTRVPLGVVVLITPYNHPLLIAMKKIAAALAAGNVVIVKPSELAPLSVLKLGELFKEAGLPDGVLQIVSGLGRETGKYLCEHPRISKIDLTGGIGTYKAIAPIAAMNMVPITAELGGKAPVCFFESVDVETAVKAALFAGFIASGQTCVTGSRILVHGDIYEAFKERLVERVKALRVGDPTDEKTQIGSVISAVAVTRCQDFVERAKNEGGNILCGGSTIKTNEEGKGFFFAPTIIETTPTSDVAQNEVFGPVLALIKCSSSEEIISVANGTSYALGASVWTNDFTQAHRVADKIEAGIVWVNGHHLNDPSSPWGGFRESGLGKENGVEAFESYSKVKSTVLNFGVKPVWFDEVVGARYG
ncbi:aldehyde dehydrogenase family-domain-containing protein [Aspergillus stella-maris]|uniref:aldehyde dehydrogenase family-domain-containing protein n=1 Tax=Aspergillus stella-maris TaxID=1810926 RepID=UPI003CCDC37F